jgi:hypothetical protein
MLLELILSYRDTYTLVTQHKILPSVSKLPTVTAQRIRILSKYSGILFELYDKVFVQILMQQVKIIKYAFTIVQ